MRGAIPLAELQHCLRNCPERFSPELLRLDLGATDGAAELAAEAVSTVPVGPLQRLLHVPGIASRLRAFLPWFRANEPHEDEMEVLQRFATHLGRVVSYRALALTDDQLDAILSRDKAIFCKGALRASPAQLEATVRTNGLYSVVLHRLYISRMRWADPSISLHDDPETALIIAGGYQSAQLRVRLFECDVPLIWTCGWTVLDIQDDKTRWFEHRGCWFDAAAERTERYLLWGVPLLPGVLRSVNTFDSAEHVDAFVRPFVEQQQRLYDQEGVQ